MVGGAMTPVARGGLQRGIAAAMSSPFGAGPARFHAGEGQPALTLDLGDRRDGVFVLFRLLGARRSRRQLDEYPWRGDLERFLPALAHMPLPAADLVE
jgi:hypothetical protein